MNCKTNDPDPNVFNVFKFWVTDRSQKNNPKTLNIAEKK